LSNRVCQTGLTNTVWQQVVSCKRGLSLCALWRVAAVGWGDVFYGRWWSLQLWVWLVQTDVLMTSLRALCVCACVCLSVCMCLCMCMCVYVKVGLQADAAQLNVLSCTSWTSPRLLQACQLLTAAPLSASREYLILYLSLLACHPYHHCCRRVLPLKTFSPNCNFLWPFVLKISGLFVCQPCKDKWPFYLHSMMLQLATFRFSLSFCCPYRR